MCEIAVQSSHVLLDVDPWEAIQKEYQPTALVLDHLEHEINSTLGGVEAANGERKAVQVALLAGADLLESMSIPDVWSDADLSKSPAALSSHITNTPPLNRTYPLPLPHFHPRKK